MITTATSQMIPELKILWKLCFHDEDTYIDFYYENRFREKETLVFLKEKQVVAMLTLMPGYVVHQYRKQLVSYVYAVATHPDHRRQGYAQALIEYVNQLTTKDYVGTFLVPASSTLFRYYEALGYQLVSNKKLLHREVDTFLKESENEELVEQLRIEPLTAQEYFRYRDIAFKEAGYVMWDEKELDYLIREFQFLGGYAQKVLIDQVEGAVLYYLDQDVLVIKETTLPDQYIYMVVQYLRKLMNFTKITIHLPKTSLLLGELIPYVMSYGEGLFGKEYVNLALD